jgi:hypothetical protein
MIVQDKDRDVDLSVQVQLPIRCMWGGQSYRWFESGLREKGNFKTTWVWQFGWLLARIRGTEGNDPSSTFHMAFILLVRGKKDK